MLKPASQTPFSGIALAELLIDDCGLPPEWLHVVTGGGSTVGNALVDHDDIALITFTGSPDVGWSIRARAPRKKVGLELGNNAPVIIEADSDWQAAATKIRVAGFSHAGQSCISTQRVLVHREIADAFTEALVKEVSSLVVGDPTGRGHRRVGADLTRASGTGSRHGSTRPSPHGAAVAHGGELDEHGVLVPTVLTGVTPDMKVCSQEVFGPVVAIAAYDDLDEALRIANDTRYGLQAAIFTRDIGDAIRAFQTLDFGGVLVNEVPTWRADQQPYGGRPRQRQHPRGPGLLGPRDDRAAHGRPLALTRHAGGAYQLRVPPLLMR